MPVPSPPIRGKAPEGTPIDVNRALPCSLPSGETRTQGSRKQAFIARTTSAPAGRTSSAVVGGGDAAAMGPIVSLGGESRRKNRGSRRKSWRSPPAGGSLDAMQGKSFKLALAQMLVEGGNKQANLKRALERIHEAASKGAQVVVLPEAMTLGWTHSSARSEADEIPSGPSCVKLCEAAHRNKIYVCTGLIEYEIGRASCRERV